MKKIFAIALKDTLIRFTSPAEWLFFLILPIFFTLIIGGGTGGRTDNRVQLYVVDEAGTPLSAALLETLEASTAVQPVLKTRDNALSDLDERKVSAVLILPEGFEWDALETGSVELELRQLPNSTNVLVAQQGVQAAISRVGSTVEIAKASVEQAEALRPFATSGDRQAYFDRALAEAQTQMDAAPQRVLETRGNTPDQIEYDPRTNSSIGQMITWVFIPLIGLSAMLAYERQIGTLRRILTTPTSRTTYLAGTVIGQVVIALVQMLILVLFGVYVMHIQWGDSPLAIGMMLISSTLAAAALGTMLGTMVKTEAQANGLSIMVGMVMAMMGGCWYPIELFPLFIRTAVKIFPTTWAMQGMLDIALRGQGASGVLPETLVLCGFALVFFSIGVWRFKYE
ncbi:MAG: ABC transporter permease [Anaerolineaceae bacterium]